MAISHWTDIADRSTTAAEIIDDWKTYGAGEQDGGVSLASWLQDRTSQIDPETLEEAADGTDWEALARQVKRDAAAQN